ncbi:hypothetical protein [Streptomyces graminofaciens]|nr:hypothetical protein [Streptomyces graminofaciens]
MPESRLAASGMGEPSPGTGPISMIKVSVYRPALTLIGHADANGS